MQSATDPSILTAGHLIGGRPAVAQRSPAALARTARPITAAFAGVPADAFTVLGTAPPRDGAVVGLSASLAVSQSTSFHLATTASSAAVPTATRSPPASRSCGESCPSGAVRLV
ncbi:MAG: hypothetical protein JSS04_16480 [Proteobacteria bacterium]|nr:hypothetical protein [Pseudomonadota bacterium]